MIRRTLTTLLLAVAVHASASAASVGQRISVAYDLYAAGLSVAALQTTVELTGKAYRVANDLRTVGLADMRVGWRADQVSQGRLADGAARPSQHTSDGVWRDEKRAISMIYADDGGVELELMPATWADAYPPVAADQRIGTVDFMSAMVQIAFAESPDAACAGTQAIFDGRRRYDMTLRADRHETLPKLGHNAYHGEALRCVIEVTRLAGFLAEEDGLEVPRKMFVWLAREATSGLILPVKMQAATGFGTAVVHLREVVADDFRQANLAD